VSEAWRFQIPPPSVVARMIPYAILPVPPAAKQMEVVGQLTPLRKKKEFPEAWRIHELPPSAVARVAP
jgi:hypothetical protein